MKAKRSAVAALVIGLCAASFSGLSDADFQTADNKDGGVTIIEYTGWDKDIVIPAKIGDKTVTAIGWRAFSEADLTGVVIPDSVTTIGERAFENNELVKLTIGKGVKTIGKGAFVRNKLTNIAIPDNVTIPYRSDISDAYGAFAGNPLVKVTLGADCVFQADAGFGYFVYYSYLCNGRKAGTYTADAEWEENWAPVLIRTGWNDWSLSYENRKKQGLEKEANGYVYTETPYGLAVVGYTGESKRLDIPNTLNGKLVKYIEGLGDYYDGKGFTGIRIPDSVVSIGTGAFAGNRLTGGAVIGSSVTYIGSGAFYKCGLTSIIIPDSVKVIADAFVNSSNRYGTFSDNKLTSITVPANLSLDESVFSADFLSAYEEGGKKAGMYTYSDEGWAYKAR